MTVRVLVADDHHVFREGLRMLLGAVDGIEVVAEAATAEQAVEEAGRARPDVVVLDLDMPGGGGLAAIPALQAAAPGARLLVLSMHGDDPHVLRAMRAGATGYLVKDATPSEVVRAVQATAEGQAVFSSAVASRLVALSADAGAQRAAVFPELTEREREVLAHIAAGRSNDAISTIMGVSTKTVRNHVSNVFAKLRVATRLEAAVRAREAGLAEPSGLGRPGPISR